MDTLTLTNNIIISRMLRSIPRRIIKLQVLINCSRYSQGQGRDSTGRNSTSRDSTAGTVKTGSVKAGSVKARSVKAGTVKAGTVS